MLNLEVKSKNNNFIIKSKLFVSVNGRVILSGQFDGEIYRRIRSMTICPKNLLLLAATIAAFGLMSPANASDIISSKAQFAAAEE